MTLSCRAPKHRFRFEDRPGLLFVGVAAVVVDDVVDVVDVDVVFVFGMTMTWKDLEHSPRTTLAHSGKCADRAPVDCSGCGKRCSHDRGRKILERAGGCIFFKKKLYDFFL